MAVDLGYVTENELLPLGLVDLAHTDAIDARLDNERAALKLFRRGVLNLAHGKLPLPPGGKSGGRPRAPRSEEEAVESYRDWLEQLKALGCEVLEDRAEVDEQDQLLWEHAIREERLVTVDDYNGLPDWIRPFDPARPNSGALNRLRIRFSLGQLDRPWLPEDRRLHVSMRDICAWPSSDEEIELFFEQFHENVNQVSRRH